MQRNRSVNEKIFFLKKKASEEIDFQKSPKCSLIVRLSFTWQKHIWAELNRWIKWIYRYPFDSGRDCQIEFGAVYELFP
jgi:hypothetical protein